MSLNQTEKGHLERIRSATTERYTPGSVLKWIKEKTFLRGKNFSTKDREYQERILNDESIEVVIKKPSQVGISEMSLRMSLALANIVPYYTISYSLPTAGFASTFVKTRLDPIIKESGSGFPDRCPGSVDLSQPCLDRGHRLFGRGEPGGVVPGRPR